jgi:hypothetical protein
VRFPIRALAFPVFLAACQQNDDRTAERPIVPLAHAKAAATAKIAKPVKPLNSVVLAADGVRFASKAGKTRQYPFGTQQAEMEAVATRFFGAADERLRKTECRGAPIEIARFGPLTLDFQDGKLAGWQARESSQVSTSDSIHPGARMRDLHVSRSVRMAPGTAKGEFEYLAADGQTIRGFTRGEGRDARIDSLYSGANCFFR